MFDLPRIIALIALYSVPVQLIPAYGNEIAAVGPYSSGNTSPKTIKFPEQFFRHVYNKPLTGKTLKEMQYAPLYLDAKTTATTSKSVGVTTANSNRKAYNEHLEPRTTNVKNVNTKCYHQHPVEHAEVLSSVSRSPGHNAVYRNFPLLVPRDKPFKAHKRSQDVVKKPIPMKKVLKKLNFIKPIPVKQHSDLLPVASTAVPFLPKERISPPFMTNQQYIVNPDISDIDDDLGPAKPKRPQVMPFNKLHRIHLNIARVYSPMSQKLQNYSGVYAMNIEKEHAQLQSDLPTILHLSKQSENKNVTYVSRN